MTSSKASQPDNTPDALAAEDAMAAELARLRRAVETTTRSVNMAIRMARDNRSRSDLLAQQLTVLTGQVGSLATLNRQVRMLAERMADLPQTGERTDEEPAEDTGPTPSWFDATPEQAQQMLLDLAQWLHDIGTRYPHLRANLTDCWHRHPWAVDALNALHLTWQRAYRSPHASPQLAADWHIRHLPSTVDLLGHELRGCPEGAHLTGSRHRPGAGHPRTPDPEALTAYATWWAETHGAGEEPWQPGKPSRAS